MAAVHSKRDKRYKHFIYNTIIKSISNPISTVADKHLLAHGINKYLGWLTAHPLGGGHINSNPYLGDLALRTPAPAARFLCFALSWTPCWPLRGFPRDEDNV